MLNFLNLDGYFEVGGHALGPTLWFFNEMILVLLLSKRTLFTRTPEIDTQSPGWQEVHQHLEAV